MLVLPMLFGAFQPPKLWASGSALIFPQDSDAGAGADPGGAGLQHGARIAQGANAAGSFHSAATAGNPTQDRHVGRGGSAG